MKKKWFAAIVFVSLLVGCAPGTVQNTDSEAVSVPETTVIRMASHASGNILNIIAEDQGFLEDEGISVVYVSAETDAQVFSGIIDGTIDVAASSGTNLPLYYISNGTNLMIFGGYDLTGCLPLFTRVDTKWNGIEDLIGKTAAFEPNFFPVTGTLLDLGYDPVNDITWYIPENQEDRIKAVENGDADYGLVGTPLNYAVISNPNIKIVTYAADIMPEYSCCRAFALSSWVHKNPNTVIALLKAWIRAMEYYDSHHEEAVEMVVSLLHNEDFARSYLDNPRFDLNTDPMKKSVERAWNYLDRLGLLNEDAKKVKIDRHINTDLYKTALDACQREYGENNPKFYEKLQAQYALNNYS